MTPVVLIFHIFLLSLIQPCFPLELVEIRPSKPLGENGRIVNRDISSLDFRKADSFLWGSGSTSPDPLANLTIYAQDNHENVVAIERLGGMLISQSCTPQGMMFQFGDHEAFTYAMQVWSWVNDADENTCIMIAGSGDCGDNQYRIPYRITGLTYNEETNIAMLSGTTGTWKDMVNSYQLQAGSLEPQFDARLKKRDIVQSLSLPLANPLPFVAKVEQGPITGELECEDCETTGELNFELRVTQNVIGIPDGVEFRMSPKGVSAVANLKLKIASNFESQRETFKETVLSIPLNGITIPGGVLNIGPFLDIDAGGEITGLEGSITVTAGVTSSLSDSALLRANLLNPLDNDFSGWTPNVDFTPPEIEAQVSATFQVFFTPAIRLKAEALGQGVETGIELKLPFIDFKVEATANSAGGVCDDPAKTLGINVETSIGAEITFEAGATSGNSPVDITIATASVPLAGFCIGTGDATVDTNIDTGDETETTSPPTASQPATSCTASNGLDGTCISTSSCSAQGGTSEAGLCPGASNIQCCSFSDGNSDSCQTDDGVSGTCISTAACSGTGGQSVPGLCAGPSNIQCCVQEEILVDDSELCVLDTSSTFGECISTSSCSRLGGTSTPGLCPGAANIQCCTYSSCFVGGQEGQCQPLSSCQGSLHAGLCGGGANVQCCLE